jgi:hypothetical protein
MLGILASDFTTNFSIVEVDFVGSFLFLPLVEITGVGDFVELFAGLATSKIQK